MAYASKYYDPVKAHEYYEKHKKLKGQNSRKSTAGLSDEAKLIAKQVKDTIKAEKDQVMNTVKERLKERISAIRESMKGLSKEEKEQLRSQITTLKEQYKDIKQKIKTKYDNEYVKELDKLKADPSMLKPKKSSKKK